nr:tape measure protein [uncultured Pseudodesulfovibrio sp.]
MPRTEMIVAAKDMASEVFKDIRGSAMGLTTAFLAVRGAIEGIANLRDIGLSFVTTAAEFETLSISLETVTGSAEQAEAATAWIQDFTRRTPYELQEVSDAFRQLAAYGLDPTQYLRPLGDTASAMGKGLNQAVEMFADAAQGEFERLKEFGVRASQKGDQVTFRWKQNGRQMVRTAEKTQTGITEALGEIFSRFEGGMEKQSAAWRGMLSNASDYWTQFRKMVMESGPFDIMKKSLKGFLDYLSTETGKLRFARAAAVTAKAVVGSFKTMAWSVKAFSQSLDYVHGGLLAIKLASLETSLLLTKMNPMAAIANKDSIVGKANTARQGFLGMEIMNTKAQLLRLKREVEGTEDAFAPILAMLDEARDAVTDVKMLAGLDVKGGGFNFGGVDGDGGAGTATKATTKAFNDRIKLEQDFANKLAKLSMDSFDFRRLQLDQEVKASEAKITAILAAEKLGGEERTRVEAHMLEQLEQYKTASLDKIAKDQRIHNAKVAEELSQSMKEMKVTALEASGSMVDGLELGMLQYRDTTKSVAEETADLMQDSMQNMNSSITDALVDGKDSFDRFFDHIYRRAMESFVVEPITGGFMSGLSGLFSGFKVPGFASGGVSYGPQLAMVSEGAYSAEAHVPLPDGRNIPVDIRGLAPVSGGNTFVFKANLSLPTPSGNQKQDESYLEKVAKSLERQFDGWFDRRMRNAQRPGGALNGGPAI